MRLEQLKENLPDYAKDIRLNLSNLFGNIESSGLTPTQFYGIALSIAYSLKNKNLIRALEFETQNAGLSDIYLAAKTAATLMAMNNVYYRAIHLAENKELTAMPANLRMNGLSNHDVDKEDFELFALAVSVINGCGLCIHSHIKQLLGHSITKVAIQSALRLAATLNALVTAYACADDNLNLEI
ncbi:carboxymuconolactone decarboxylase family protein [Legionella yabuuchiae]|uniref:carboxymuconolactone decarboxylase family protein n=1 Tax=Legionella yabuuchiae TaxID=376727 RepID=UPI0010562CCC|nr:carboxymuconolactone decarboxylase family protein [Legionella yabuuchiae]